MDKVFNKLRNLDAYPKINEDFFSRTLSGGVITLVSSIVMLLLFFSELSNVQVLLSKPNTSQNPKPQLTSLKENPVHRSNNTLFSARRLCSARDSTQF
ncbi:unnamed protein product [Ilex paraguariensis]|uniref:Endoplasmic reticulum vesicle transporter N-terminal domain-containing protein n=1 Tax=Ilex paraguariensis TaxID=185542 RepID=A0ABC8UKS6_9AQUA